MSNASLRSARVYSIIIMVLGYVGCSFVWQHQQRLSVLSEARRAMAQIIVDARASENYRSSDDPAESAVAAVIRASVGEGTFPALGEIEADRYTDDNGRLLAAVRVLRRGGGRWGVAGSAWPAGADDLNRSFQSNFENRIARQRRVGDVREYRAAHARHRGHGARRGPRIPRHAGGLGMRDRDAGFSRHSPRSRAACADGRRPRRRGTRRRAS